MFDKILADLGAWLIGEITEGSDHIRHFLLADGRVVEVVTHSLDKPRPMLVRGVR